jgi:hypothetical protein
METEKIQNDIKNQILEKIKSGEVNMKPKYYFIIKLVALALTVFLTFILSTMLVSYVIFSIKISGQFFLLGFGAKGLYHFFIALPWFILGIDVLLIFFLDWLLKSFKFGYNSSVMFLFVVTLVSITVLASLINSTSFHRDMMLRAEGRGLPIAGGFYNDLRRSHKSQGLFRGEIMSIEGTSTFYIRYVDQNSNVDGDTAKIVVPNSIDIFSLGAMIGDTVYIAGDSINGEIHAYGIRKLTSE